MSSADNTSIVRRWFTEFRGNDFNLGVTGRFTAPEMPVGSLTAGIGKAMRFKGITMLKIQDGRITEEVGLDDGLTVLGS